jgi:uncharacterized iron-regulated protein
MIPESLQADLDRYLQSGPPDASALGSILQWKQRGWPDWAMYRPIAEVALSAGLPMLAGGLDRETLKGLASAEPSPSSAKMIEELGLAQPVKPEISKAQGQEINDGHCNMLPEAAIEPMIKAQRARDAYLAKAVLSGKDGTGAAVLIAGSGHVRKDWAVPHIIHQKLPGAKVVSIAFLEVDPERTLPSDYVRAVPGLEEQFDYIYLTPRADLTDHCAEFRKHMEKKKSGKAG